MLHLKFRKTPYMDTRIEIVPDDEDQIPDLRGMLRNYAIENPVKSFTDQMREGDYQDLDDDEITDRWEMATKLNGIWNVTEMGGEQSSLNVMLVLSRLMQAYIDQNNNDSQQKGDELS